jgi:hypothetical protein
MQHPGIVDPRRMRMAAPPSMANRRPMMAARPRAHRVHAVARVVFGLLILESMTNAIGLFITYERNVSD